MCVRYFISLFIFILFLINNIFSDTRIIIPLKNAPLSIIKEASKEALSSPVADQISKIVLKGTGAVSKKILKKELREYFAPSLGGFFALYGGFITASNNEGLIAFPLRHTTKKLYISITPLIKLVKVKGETISHQEYISSPDNPIKLYMCEQKTNKKGHVYWSVKQENIPNNKKVNPITVLILTKPKNLFLQEGDFLSSESSHMILPEIYVVGQVEQEKTVMHMLDLKHYYEPIQWEEKKGSDISLQKIMTTI